MSWYLKAIEQADGSWIPNFGPQDLPVQPDATTALAFMAAAAAALGGKHLFRLYLYHRDGSVDSVPATGPLPGR